MNLKAPLGLAALLGSWMLPASFASAESSGALLLAEIVVPAQPDSGKKAAKSAAEVRGKAKAYQEPGSPTIIVIPEEEEEGLLDPRRQGESHATENRAKARNLETLT